MLMGAMIAIAAGTTEPKPVRIAVTMKNTQGMSATRPPTTFTSACTIQSTVPLSFARAKRYVTPTRMRNRSAGNPDRRVSTSSPSTRVPKRKVAMSASAPMWTDVKVAMTNSATRTSMERTSRDTLRSHANRGGSDP